MAVRVCVFMNMIMVIQMISVNCSNNRNVNRYWKRYSMMKRRITTKGMSK